MKIEKRFLELTREPTSLRVGDIIKASGLMYSDRFEIHSLWEAYSYDADSAQTILGY